MHELQDDDAYMVLASDGLWATTDNEDVASLVEAHERATRLSLTPGWLKHAKGMSSSDQNALLSLRSALSSHARRLTPAVRDGL